MKTHSSILALATVETSPRARVLATLTLRTLSEANWRGPWQVRARRVKAQRLATYAALCASGYDPHALLDGRLVVTLVRVATRSLDTDNLAGACKAIRDSVATWLGVDDGPKGPVTWAYAQEVTKSPLQRVRIEVGA